MVEIIADLRGEGEPPALIREEKVVEDARVLGGLCTGERELEVAETLVALPVEAAGVERLELFGEVDLDALLVVVVAEREERHFLGGEFLLKDFLELVPPGELERDGGNRVLGAEEVFEDQVEVLALLLLEEGEQELGVSRRDGDPLLPESSEEIFLGVVLSAESLRARGDLLLR